MHGLERAGPETWGETDLKLFWHHLRSRERWRKRSEKRMQETWGWAEVRGKSRDTQTNMLAVHKQGTRIFSHKNAFFPLPGCTGPGAGSSPPAGLLGPPAPVTPPHEKRFSHQGAQNKAFGQPRGSTGWMPQTWEKARLDFWLFFHNPRSAWAVRQLHFPVCHQHGMVGRNHREPRVPPSWKCFLCTSADRGFYRFPSKGSWGSLWRARVHNFLRNTLFLTSRIGSDFHGWFCNNLRLSHPGSQSFLSILQNSLFLCFLL